MRGNLPLQLWLGYPGSNQDKDDQNVLCYHYTIAQSSCKSYPKVTFATAKVQLFLEKPQPNRKYFHN